jgi:hypothetical protein
MGDKARKAFMYENFTGLWEVLVKLNKSDALKALFDEKDIKTYLSVFIVAKEC